MNMKKILFLGGARNQLSILKLAKSKGYFIILCDGYSECPGKKYSNKFFNCSISNKEEILKIAKKENVNAIISYASEAGALTQSFVANKLKLPSNSLKSVKTLLFKNKFRDFLKKNKFFFPKFKVFSNFNNFNKYLKNNKNHVIIKPVDSAGSRGVFKIDFQNLSEIKKLFLITKKFSKKKKVICEEFINTNFPQIAGDAIIFDNKIVFSHWADQYYNKLLNPLLPIGESWPTSHGKKNILYIETELNRLFKKLKISFGIFNFDLRLVKNNKLMIIEIGPRNGGDFIPDVVKDASGVNMIEQTLNLHLGKKILKKDLIKSKNNFCATLRVGSQKNGIFKRVIFSKELNNHIYKKIIHVKKNTLVKKFISGRNSLGNIFLRFKTSLQMRKNMESINKNIKVILK